MFWNSTYVSSVDFVCFRFLFLIWGNLLNLIDFFFAVKKWRTERCVLKIKKRFCFKSRVTYKHSRQFLQVSELLLLILHECVVTLLMRWHEKFINFLLSLIICIFLVEWVKSIFKLSIGRLTWMQSVIAAFLSCVNWSK